MQRRDFLRWMSLGGAYGLAQSAGIDLALGEVGKEADPALVFIFLRGAMDGLSVVAPVEDAFYQKMRPNIKVTGEPHKLRKAGGPFVLHPSLQPLYPLWDQKSLVFIHQCGSPDSTRSHFDAQDFMESGHFQRNDTTGFLNRALKSAKVPEKSWASVALQSNLPRSLQGAFPSIAFNSLKDLNLKTSSSNSASIEQMYATATDTLFRQTGRELFSGLQGDKKRFTEIAQKNFPTTAIGKHLKDISLLIRARCGVRVAVTEMGGWDTHARQGTMDGGFAKNLLQLSESLAVFVDDLGKDFERTQILLMTEFGRTVRENGNRGTDHGHGSVAWVLGGNVRGGRIIGSWGELSETSLYENRDLAITTDFREVMATAVQTGLKIPVNNDVFLGYQLKKNLSWT